MYALSSSRTWVDVMSARLPGADAERLLQVPPCARESRHHGTDRRAGDARDLLVRQVLELTQHEGLAEFGSELIERPLQLRPVGLLQSTGVGGTLRGESDAMLVLDVLDRVTAGARATPGV